MATNTVNFGMLDPSLSVDQAALERNMALATALRQQAMAPVDTKSRMMGNIAYRISPLEGLAKLLQGQQANNLDTENDSSRMAMAQRQSDLVRALLGMGTNSPDAASTASLAQGAAASPPVQGDDGSLTNTGGIGPTNDNAQRMASILKGNQGNQGGGALSVTGDPNKDFAMMMFAPDAFNSALGNKYQTTDATRMAMAGKVDPVAANRGALAKANTAPGVFEQTQAGMTPAEIRQAAIATAAKQGEVERRGGNEFANFFTNQSGIVPKIPEFSNPVGPVASNGGLPGGVERMPGSLPIAGANAQATAGGAASGQFQQVTTPGGAVVPVRGSEIGPGGTLTAKPGVTGNFEGNQLDIVNAISQIPDPQERANAMAAFQEQARRTQGFSNGAPLQLGQSTQNKTTQEAGGKMLTDLPMQVMQSKQTVQGLQNAYALAEHSGPGVSSAANVTAILNNLGLPVAKDDVTNFQTMKKFLANSASTAAASNGFTGSDARFDQFQAGQPNPDTMNPEALKGAIRYVLSQHDAAIARGSFIMDQAKSNPNDPNAVQNASQKWSQMFNPKVFEFNRMTPQDRAAFKAQLSSQSPERAKQFGDQYNFAHQQGWVQ